MIRLNAVSKQYPCGHVALQGVDFHVPRGEMVFVTGHSGAGKSTLLKLIMLMERPSGGEILVGGQALDRVPRRQIPYIRRHIGVVFQNHQLLFDRTVFDNVALPLEVMGASPRDVARRVRAALDMVGLLSKERQNPVQLSGGEQQRIGIARAVVNKPSLLLADEPTGNLDPHLSADIMHLFEQFNQVGVTVLIASHDIALIRHMPHRVVSLHEGRLYDGSDVVSDEAPAVASLAEALDLRH
ncbi:MAG: cell division ATP-binding protein FtsE, partial [Gammaproteobacteria bacterium]|nr:cell division ATP-binding protein FtsE [Gammaproteobacteria bacterium]